MTAGGVTLKKGDIITIDGAAGEVMQGAVPMVKPELTGDFATLMGWADGVRRMKVRANAETPDRRAPRPRLRRRRHRPLPHRAHVLRGRAHRRDARDDPGRDRGGAARRARQAPADAAAGLRRSVRDHDRPAGHDPPARSAAARVPAEDGRGDRRGGQGDGGQRRQAAQAARPSCTSSTRCSASAAAAGRALSRDRRDAGARHLRRRGRSRQARPASRSPPRSWCR